MSKKTKKELNNGNCSAPHGTDSVRGSHYNSTTSVPKSQCLQDVSTHKTLEIELSEKFTPKRKDALKLAASYNRLGFERKAERVNNCSTYLEFAKYLDDSYKLHRANFCRDRLCPLCSWRRTLKIYHQVSQIMNLIQNDYVFIFVTLTVPNCSGEDLARTIDNLNKGWAKFIKRKRIDKINKGFFRVLEVNYSRKRDDYHPHFHVVFAVPKGYFKSDDYIKRDDWLLFWQQSMKDPTITQVDVRRVYDKDKSGSIDGLVIDFKKAVSEVAKYSVKSTDYLFASERQTDFCVYTFSEALYNRRLLSMGGCFQDAHDKLHLDDSESGDLVHTAGEMRSDVIVQIVKYRWGAGVYDFSGSVDTAMDDINILAECDED